MTTITWKIDWMQTTPATQNPPEAVLIVGWQCVGIDGVYSGVMSGSSAVAPADPADFTPYADLTQDQVLGWVWQSGVDKDGTEAAVQAQIDLAKNPPVIQPPLPWASQP